VPADGFYEWVAEGKVRKPLWIRREDGKPLALAGLWEMAKDMDGAALQTFSIVTTASRGVLAPIHDRCPVILGEAGAASWLAPHEPTDEIAALMQPAEHGLLVSPADPRANSVRNDDRHLIEAPPALLF